MMSNALNLSSMTTTIQAMCRDDLRLKILTCANYATTHQAMLTKILDKIEQKKLGNRLADEIWLVEHSDVYTLGQAGKLEHILQKNQTPIIKTDRGGQVTWHGTGQLVAYFLFDLQALSWGVRHLVSHAEQAIEDVIGHYLPQQLTAKARQDAPGVYLYQGDNMLGKIASLGFKIKQSHSYHGVAINLTNDLSAFLAINPCGYQGMTMTKLESVCVFDTQEFICKFVDNIIKRRQNKIALR